MSNDTQDDDGNPKSAGRWATITSVLGALGLLMGAAFANQFAARLGIPTTVSYGLAGLGGVTILLLNAGMGGSLSKAIYGVVIIVFLLVLAIVTLTGCALAFVDGGFSGESLISMGIFAGIFVLAALSAWRLKALMARA